MLGINSLDALSFNYVVIADSSGSSTRGLGFPASAGFNASLGETSNRGTGQVSVVTHDHARYSAGHERHR